MPYQPHGFENILKVKRYKFFKNTLKAEIKDQAHDIRYLVVVRRHPSEEDECAPVVTEVTYNKHPHRRLGQQQLPWDVFHRGFRFTVPHYYILLLLSDGWVFCRRAVSLQPPTHCNTHRTTQLHKQEHVPTSKCEGNHT
jgi:hypothetical protein